MPLNSSAGIQKDHDEAFRVRIEIGMVNHMGAPIRCSLIRRVAELHFYWRGTFSQHLDFEFLRIENIRSLELLRRVQEFQLHMRKEKAPLDSERGFRAKDGYGLETNSLAVAEICIKPDEFELRKFGRLRCPDPALKCLSFPHLRSGPKSIMSPLFVCAAHPISPSSL